MSKTNKVILDDNRYLSLSVSFKGTNDSSSAPQIKQSLYYSIFWVLDKNVMSQIHFSFNCTLVMTWCLAHLLLPVTHPHTSSLMNTCLYCRFSLLVLRVGDVTFLHPPSLVLPLLFLLWSTWRLNVHSSHLFHFAMIGCGNRFLMLSIGMVSWVAESHRLVEIIIKQSASTI